MKLYIYDHCPYCLKARMIFGLKNIPVELHVLLNDDAETPTRMVGQKQVPILQKDDSRYMPESMDIVHYVDKLDGKPLLTGKRSPAIEEWLRKVNGYANKLLLPRFAKSAFDEFSTPAARKYFVDKKEASAGNFADLLAHSDGLIKNISDDLRALDKLIVKPNAVNGELSEDDIQLFPLLRNLTLVAGINWPSRVADYRDNMAKTDTNQFVIINGDLILTRRGSLYSRVAAVFSFFCWRVYRW
ncbi:glutaredoxin [Escherichia coli]|uniref:Glutaredoxin n=39 Tax=Gammaproteobacteria TaxID=1236 RepID=A0A377DV29_ECOLX|nr:glutaredoxin [Escherichia coli]